MYTAAVKITCALEKIMFHGVFGLDYTNSVYDRREMLFPH